MSTAPTRVFVARLSGLAVFDPQGEQVGKVRDVVVVRRTGNAAPRAVGLVVEVFGRRRVFAPMTRVTTIDAGNVIITGLLNMRRFEQRTTETLVIAQLFDRRVTLPSGEQGVVFDIALEQQRSRDWVISRVAVAVGGGGFRRKPQTHVVPWDQVEGLQNEGKHDGAAHLMASLADLKPADVAHVINDLDDERRSEVIEAMDDETLAEVLEELPEEDQVEILGHLDVERAADVLEEMSPDDAADLIADLPPETAQRLLGLMEPDEAEDVRRLLSYGEQTAGGMMTPEPVIVSPDATIADALARARNEDLTPSLAAMVYVCRAPLETPTGRFLGIAHIQRLLREPPSTLVAGALDTMTTPLRPEATVEEVAMFMATYNLVAAPVVDENNHLLGVVTVDDLLDHLLPEGWRDHGVGKS
ncbi:MAG: magnesium transporter MgtE N-terminal domain-containing protein [Marmoricola sp.]